MPIFHIAQLQVRQRCDRLEQQPNPQPIVANLIATPDAIHSLSPALADTILPFLNKFPDGCFRLTFAFALMHAFAIATASKRPKSRLSFFQRFEELFGGGHKSKCVRFRNIASDALRGWRYFFAI